MKDGESDHSVLFNAFEGFIPAVYITIPDTPTYPCNSCIVFVIQFRSRRLCPILRYHIILQYMYRSIQLFKQVPCEVIDGPDTS